MRRPLGIVLFIFSGIHMRHGILFRKRHMFFIPRSRTYLLLSIFMLVTGNFRCIYPCLGKRNSAWYVRSRHHSALGSRFDFYNYIITVGSMGYKQLEGGGGGLLCMWSDTGNQIYCEDCVTAQQMGVALRL
ncbi:hypothetical protein F4809DRAFT_606769 [Biscogniauxia mediterranea]|nr:hypothetical protein F4809DRAFT_606769 [Biscogniauxia mediterranea]